MLTLFCPVIHSRKLSFETFLVYDMSEGLVFLFRSSPFLSFLATLWDLVLSPTDVGWMIFTKNINPATHRYLFLEEYRTLVTGWILFKLVNMRGRRKMGRKEVRGKIMVPRLFIRTVDTPYNHTPSGALPVWLYGVCDYIWHFEKFSRSFFSVHRAIIPEPFALHSPLFLTLTWRTNILWEDPHPVSWKAIHSPKVSVGRILDQNLPQSW
jgi:hypothetical protein